MRTNNIVLKQEEKFHRDMKLVIFNRIIKFDYNFLAKWRKTIFSKTKINSNWIYR